MFRKTVYTTKELLLHCCHIQIIYFLIDCAFEATKAEFGKSKQRVSLEIALPQD